MEEAKGGLEERVARIEGILSQMNERLNHLETEVSGLRAEFNGGLDRFESRVEARFNQLFYAVITSWVTIIAALLVAIFKG
jgi:predicted nuclease with TOPRIM domain